MRAKVLLVVLAFVGPSSILTDRAHAQVTITKVPVHVSTQTFDPRQPPRRMPSLTPPEQAVCASDFLSNASVGGQTEQIDATHGKLTINKINVTLRLDITIWLPKNPPRTTVDHEEGHRQISEYYYRIAEMVARRITKPFLGKVIDLNGRDLRKLASAALKQTGAEITNEYNKQMAVETTQSRFDAVTEHSRKDIRVADAVALALKDTYPFPPTAAPLAPR